MKKDSPQGVDPSGVQPQHANTDQTSSSQNRVEPMNQPQVITPLQILNMFEQVNEALGRLGGRIENMELSRQINLNHDESSVLPPQVEGRRPSQGRQSIEFPCTRPTGERSADRDRVPVDTILRTQEKVNPDHMGKTMTLTGLYHGYQHQIEHERLHEQYLKLSKFMTHRANLELKHMIDATPSHPLHSITTESSIYDWSDEKYTAIAAATIRSKNRTSEEISKTVLKSLPELEFHRDYRGGILQYHTYVFPKISKLITDMEWRINFIYLDAKDTEIKLWPERKYGKPQRPGFLLILMQALDKNRRMQLSEMFTEFISEDSFKEMKDFAPFFKALRAANQHFNIKAREIDEEQAALRKPLTIDQIRQNLQDREEPQTILQRPRDLPLRGTSDRGYTPNANKRFFRKPQGVVRLIGDGNEESFVSAIDADPVEMDESDFVVMSLFHESDEDDIAIQVDQTNRGTYVNALQQTGYKRINNPSLPGPCAHALGLVGQLKYLLLGADQHDVSEPYVGRQRRLHLHIPRRNEDRLLLLPVERLREGEK